MVTPTNAVVLPQFAIMLDPRVNPAVTRDTKVVTRHVELSWQEVDISFEGHVFLPIPVSTFMLSKPSEPAKLNSCRWLSCRPKPSEPVELISCRRLSFRARPLSQPS